MVSNMHFVRFWPEFILRCGIGGGGGGDGDVRGGWRKRSIQGKQNRRLTCVYLLILSKENMHGTAHRLGEYVEFTLTHMRS